MNSKKGPSSFSFPCSLGPSKLHSDCLYLFDLPSMVALICCQDFLMFCQLLNFNRCLWQADFRSNVFLFSCQLCFPLLEFLQDLPGPSQAWSPGFSSLILGFCILLQFPADSKVVYSARFFARCFTPRCIWNWWSFLLLWEHGIELFVTRQNTVSFGGLKIILVCPIHECMVFSIILILYCKIQC